MACQLCRDIATNLVTPVSTPDHFPLAFGLFGETSVVRELNGQEKG